MSVHESTKLCKDCGKPGLFYRANSKVNLKYFILRARCVQCHNRWLNTPSKQMSNRLNHYKRKDPECDFDRDFIKTCFSAPCTYCLRTGREMCIDRVDSSLGYVKNNAIPSCKSCNNIKSDMSPKAWAIVLPAVRKAVELGLL